MQFSIPVYSLTGEAGCKQYLAASDSRKISKKMDFDFPDIQEACPVCFVSGHAIWKGYFLRRFCCPILDYYGWIWARKGYCEPKKTHFSMLPDFCIPQICWSKFLFSQLLHLKGKFLSVAFDWDIESSTLYWIGALLVKLLRINSHLYCQQSPLTNSVCELQSFSSEEMKILPFLADFKWNKKIKPSATGPPF